MKNILIKNIHLIIILYASWSVYQVHLDKEIELDQVSSEIPVMGAKIERAKSKLVKIKKFKKNLTASKQRIKEVHKRIEKIRKKLPADINDTEVQRILTDISNSLKIVDPHPVPALEEESDFYYSKDYKLKGKGTFLQFLIFFENLANADRILNVKEINLNAIEAESTRSRFQVLSVETTIESYRYNENYREELGGKKI